MSPGHRPDCDCAECQRVYDETFGDVPEALCAACGEPVDAHWFLTMSVDELRDWDENDKACTATREDVVKMIEASETERGPCL